MENLKYSMMRFNALFINYFIVIGTGRMLVILTMLSEILNLIKINPIAYALKVLVDIHKEYLKFALMLGLLSTPVAYIEMPVLGNYRYTFTYAVYTALGNTLMLLVCITYSFTRSY